MPYNFYYLYSGLYGKNKEHLNLVLLYKDIKLKCFKALNA